MKIAVIHRSLDLLGGGERVCMSLLGALDRTRHETVLRCAVPPPGVRFAGGDGDGDGGGGGGGGDPPRGAWGGPRPRPPFRRVRLDLVPGPVAGPAPDPAAEAGSLLRRTGCDVAVVTDGGLALGRTDAPRVVWYCNTALRSELRLLSLPRPRHPRNMLRLWRFKRPFRRMMAAARKKKVAIVPNSESTRREVSAAIGRAVRGPVVYPPVDVERFAALREVRKERRTATVARFGPEKSLGAAVRIMREAGGRYDIVGNASARHPDQLGALEDVRRSASAGMRLHVNAGQDILEGVVGGARAYLQTSEETFGVAVVEAAAAGCVPVVPDNSAHPETVPFAELRYGSEGEAAGIVRGEGRGGGSRRAARLPAAGAARARAAVLGGGLSGAMLEMSRAGRGGGRVRDRRRAAGRQGAAGMQVMAAAQGRPASAAIAPAARMSAARGGGKHDALRRGIAAHAGAYLALRARRRPVEPVHRAADGVRRLEYPAGRPPPPAAPLGLRSAAGCTAFRRIKSGYHAPVRILARRPPRPRASRAPDLTNWHDGRRRPIPLIRDPGAKFGACRAKQHSPPDRLEANADAGDRPR